MSFFYEAVRNLSDLSSFLPLFLWPLSPSAERLSLFLSLHHSAAACMIPSASPVCLQTGSQEGSGSSFPAPSLIFIILSLHGLRLGGTVGLPNPVPGSPIASLRLLQLVYLKGNPWFETKGKSWSWNEDTKLGAE